LLTNDIPLADVPAAVTCEALSNRLAGFNRSLIRDFNIVRPRIAVLALNPEKPGKAEEEIIIPAISEAVRQGMVALGPYPADTFFSGDYHLMFDGILAMYYDQAMPVFRALTEIRGLRYMAETPAVITSTVHGAAYDIAGQGKASEESLRQAIYTATDSVRNRRNYAEATRNPLRRQYFDKGSAADEKIDLTKEDYPAEAGSDILL
jgi:4-hydroxythreonine-4-phosphate dehydrogenase